MLEEKAAQQGVRNHSVLELIQNRSTRWQLLTVLACYTTIQLCGINAVSHVRQPQHAEDDRKLHFNKQLENSLKPLEKGRPLAASGSTTTRLCDINNWTFSCLGTPVLRP